MLKSVAVDSQIQTSHVLQSKRVQQVIMATLGVQGKAEKQTDGKQN